MFPIESGGYVFCYAVPVRVLGPSGCRTEFISRYRMHTQIFRPVRSFEDELHNRLGIVEGVRVMIHSRLMNNSNWCMQFLHTLFENGCVFNNRHHLVSITYFFKDKPSSTFQTVRYYIDCGDDEERLYAGNGELHSLLRDKNIKHEYRVRNGAHTDSYWRESMKEALPFIERSFKGENYPQETLKKFTEELHATNKNIKVGNSNIELWLPDDYNSELTYKVLYYSKGEGNVDLTTKKVAVALDSLMQIKRMIIAGFNVKEMIQNETNFSAITDAVEKTVHTESNADFRLGLTYGSEADYLYNQSTGNAPAINFFFAEDADIINLSAENRAKIYYLDITDEGSNYNSIFTLFNGLRGAEAPVQYRVRNGLDSEQSAQTGIYSMSYYIGEQLIKK